MVSGLAPWSSSLGSCSGLGCCGMFMGIGKFDTGGRPAIDWQPIQEVVQILLVASHCWNRLDGPLGLCASLISDGGQWRMCDVWMCLNIWQCWRWANCITNCLFPGLFLYSLVLGFITSCCSGKEPPLPPFPPNSRRPVLSRGGSRGRVQGVCTSPPWDEAFFFVLAFKICLPRQSVTSFLRGAPPPKKNPG